MEDHGTVGELDERFGEGEGEGSQTGAEATDLDIVSFLCRGEVGVGSVPRMRAGVC